MDTVMQPEIFEVQLVDKSQMASQLTEASSEYWTEQLCGSFGSGVLKFATGGYLHEAEVGDWLVFFGGKEVFVMPDRQFRRLYIGETQ
jgi:hypothetical protein